jgi:hypothetical protein
MSFTYGSLYPQSTPSIRDETIVDAPIANLITVEEDGSKYQADPKKHKSILIWIVVVIAILIFGGVINIKPK